MIYNFFLFLLVVGIGAFLLLKAIKLSSETEKELQPSQEQEMLKAIEEIIRNELSKNKQYEKKIEIGQSLNLEAKLVSKIDSHPNYVKKRA